MGKKGENGPTIATLYSSSLGVPLSEICCKSADAESERSKFFFNGTISTPALEMGPLAGSKNISSVISLFNTGNAYVEVYTYQARSLVFSDPEIRGQIIPQPIVKPLLK